VVAVAFLQQTNALSTLRPFSERAHFSWVRELFGFSEGLPKRGGEFAAIHHQQKTGVWSLKTPESEVVGGFSLQQQKVKKSVFS
jgi:hypothetical protein